MECLPAQQGAYARKPPAFLSTLLIDAANGPSDSKIKPETIENDFQTSAKYFEGPEEIRVLAP